jgi:hypothetical protein
MAKYFIRGEEAWRASPDVKAVRLMARLLCNDVSNRMRCSEYAAASFVVISLSMCYKTVYTIQALDKNL